MKLHKINDCIQMASLFIVRFVKLCAITVYLIFLSYRRYDYAHQSIRFLGVNWLRPKYYRNFYDLTIDAFRGLYGRSLILAKCIYVYYTPIIGHSLDRIVIIAYICEKMGVNVRFELRYYEFSYFENGTLINRENWLRYPYYPFPRDTAKLAWFAIFALSPEYGHKIISQLCIKERFKKVADEWFDKHIQGNWVAVHYRGTDVETGKEGCQKLRYRMELDNYITYLQAVLENQSSIFACSDQQQFIDKMHEAFPGRVFTRDIQRSCDQRTLHLDEKYQNIQQQTDAVIDLLILAKAELIYTTGSGFVDAVRYFNPKIKIVSMDGRRIGRGKNNIPIPRKNLYEKLKIPYE